MASRVAIANDSFYNFTLMTLKFLPSIRFGALAILVFLIIGLVIYGFLPESSECSFSTEDLKNNSFYANVKGQEIDIIGWYHGTAERDLAQYAMSEAFGTAKNGNCKLAQDKIESALKKLTDQRTESLRVLQALDEIYKKRNFKKLGVEYGPQQFREEFLDSETQKNLSLDLISIFKRLCPQQVQQFTDLYLIFPGPEYKFALDQKGSVEIVPLGNDELIKQSFLAYSSESRFFPQQIDQLSLSGRQAYDQFTEVVKNGKPLSQSKIDALTMTLSEPEKYKVQKYFKEISQVLSLIGARNDAFIDEILKAKSNIAVVVGNFHVPGFREILKHGCKVNE